MENSSPTKTTDINKVPLSDLEAWSGYWRTLSDRKKHLYDISIRQIILGQIFTITVTMTAGFFISQNTEALLLVGTALLLYPVLAESLSYKCARITVLSTGRFIKKDFVMINSRVLMSGVNYFDDNAAINPYMDSAVPVDLEKAAEEHAAIRAALEISGVEVVRVEPPANCQDGVYTANWALVHDKKAVMSRLPNARSGEEAYAETVLQNLGFEIVKTPENLRFSGQGDALPCGDLLFAGSQYRTDRAAHSFLQETLGLQVISLQTVPSIVDGAEVINSHSGWPDSFFYDIDLALAVIRDDLIVWCPEAFTPESQETMCNLGGLKKIEVSLEEAVQHFACNLVSTGEAVIMNAGATSLQKALENEELQTVSLTNPELAKGGGSIRCTTLTL